MKRIVIISALSLIFFGVNAQRSVKTRTSDENEANRNKSEMTVRRSTDQKTRSLENKTNRPGNEYSYRTETKRNTYERPANRHSGSSANDRKESVNNNRNVTEKIIRSKTDLHKNINPRESRSVDVRTNDATHSGRNNSINTRTYDQTRSTYQTPYRTRIHREIVHVNRPRTIEYRRVHFPYRTPVNVHIIWTPRMYREYVLIYPDFRYWYYPAGYRILTVPAYDAIYYTGEVVNVYGRVHEAWYCWQTDEYFLYFGASYPYHDFSVIIPGHKARQISRIPEKFFTGRYIWVTGLISQYQGKPEMIIRKKHQIHLY